MKSKFSEFSSRSYRTERFPIYRKRKRKLTSLGKSHQGCHESYSAKQYETIRQTNLEAILPFPMSLDIDTFPTITLTSASFPVREYSIPCFSDSVNETREALAASDFCNYDVKKRILWKVGTQYLTNMHFCSVFHSYRQIACTEDARMASREWRSPMSKLFKKNSVLQNSQS